MDLFVPTVALLALINKFVDFSKYITNKDVNGALTQVYVWGAGVLGVWLYAQTAWADTINFGDLPLSKFNGASIVAVGFAIASAGSVAKDWLKAKDNSDSAAMPKLLPNAADS